MPVIAPRYRTHRDGNIQDFGEDEKTEQPRQHICAKGHFDGVGDAQKREA